jgi:hypothetical protein
MAKPKRTGPRAADEFMADRETEAAAEEAGSIGGDVPEEEGLDDAERPLAEAGQGESEGFEEAERDLIESAEHGEDYGSPLDDAGKPEEPHDEEHGEADQERKPDA